MSETASERLEEDELGRPVNQYWTVAAVFGHIAFWDARVLALADKLERGVPLSPSDAEPADVDWINDASRALIYAIPRHEGARLALQIAEETDARVATLPPDRLWQRDPDNPIYAVLARHRGPAPRRGRVGPSGGWVPGRVVGLRRSRADTFRIGRPQRPTFKFSARSDERKE